MNNLLKDFKIQPTKLRGENMSICESSITNPKKQLEFYKQLSEQLQQENQELKRNCNIGEENLNFYREENQELKKQLEEYQLENIDLRADIMIQKKAFPHKEIKDKTFYDLYNMPTYEDLLNQQKEFIEYLEDNEIKFDIKANGMGASSERDELIIKARAYREILSKYKEIVGISNEHN